jgi:hypothetical protein
LFATGGGSERARIDSSGRLLVGTSSARSNFYNTSVISGLLQVEGTNNSTRVFSQIHNTADAGGPLHVLAKSRGTATGSNTVVQADDQLGEVSFQGSDGTEFVAAGYIGCSVDGTPGANDMPGRLVFATTGDGTVSPTERMRITNDGNLLFGVTTTANPGTGNRGFLVRNDSASQTFIQIANTLTSGVGVAYFYNANGLVGQITTSGSSTSYGTSSDYRLKENVVFLTGAIDRVNQLQVHRFNFIADPDTTVDGFIAHEAQAVVPECVTGTKDEVDADGNPVYQGIDQSKLVPLLTAALQEAIGRIEILEAEVAALKAS